jgi:hypothetical protein
MSKFSNIKEWVARRVILHLKYRDEEVEKLKRIIEKIDPTGSHKCEYCKDYEEIVNMECDWCWMKVCSKCIDKVIIPKGRHKLCLDCVQYCEFCSPNIYNSESCICDKMKVLEICNGSLENL